MSQSTALVTGANRGIGLGLCAHLLKRDINVIATIRSEPSAGLRALADEAGDRLQLEKLDVTAECSATALAERLGGRPLDYLFNNAGVMSGHGERPPNIDIEAIAENINTNLFGVIRVYQALRGNLLQSERPVHVAITSKMGSLADNTSGGAYAYRISKSALNMFIKSLAIDDEQVISLAVHPGWVVTDMGGPNALINVDQSAGGIVGLATEASAKLSGHFLNYDGSEIPW